MGQIRERENGNHKDAAWRPDTVTPYVFASSRSFMKTSECLICTCIQKGSKKKDCNWETHGWPAGCRHVGHVRVPFFTGDIVESHCALLNGAPYAIYKGWKCWQIEKVGVLCQSVRLCSLVQQYYMEIDNRLQSYDELWGDYYITGRIKTSF